MPSSAGRPFWGSLDVPPFVRLGAKLAVSPDRQQKGISVRRLSGADSGTFDPRLVLLSSADRDGRE
jgi:hypothetical protein